MLVWAVLWVELVNNKTFNRLLRKFTSDLCYNLKNKQIVLGFID